MKSEPVAIEPQQRTSQLQYRGKPVYAVLDRDGGGSWIFKTLSSSSELPQQGYLVQLAELAPAFDTHIAECEPQTYPRSHKCNPLHEFRDKHVGIVKKVITSGIAAGTAGKISGIGHTYTTEFDEPLFNKAVDEALTNTGLGDQREQFLLLLEQFTGREAQLVESMAAL